MSDSYLVAWSTDVENIQRIKRVEAESSTEAACVCLGESADMFEGLDYDDVEEHFFRAGITVRAFLLCGVLNGAVTSRDGDIDE